MPAPTASREPALLRRWPLAVLLVLGVHLALGIFGRTVWKPDEPREAAIAGRMARAGADLAVPHLGNAAFCEKPPLYYWAAAGAMRLLGPGAVPARVPNLVYALAGALLVGALAGAASGRVAALAAALLMGTFYLAYRIEIWIATDALLMLSVAGALFGCFRGLVARRGWRKLSWYTLMHAFLAIGFLTKNVVAWIVPGLALVVFLTWERRWRELLAWELYAGLALQAAVALPWVLAVAAEPDGVAYLRVFFVDNLLGRFTPIPGVGYTESHRGWPGKYLIELPVYLLPWTLGVAAAVAEAWRATREPVAGAGEAAHRERSGWRFAASSVVPGLLVLSASTTMRDIYAGVLMPGFALLGGLWLARAVASPNRLSHGAARGTAWLLAAVAVLLPAASAFVAWRSAAPPGLTRGFLSALPFALALLAAAGALKAARRGRLGSAFSASVGAWILTLLATAIVVFPSLNRSQDLSPIATAAAAVATEHPLVVWQPDETVVATLDFFAGLTPPAVSSDADLARLLAAEPRLRVLTEVTPGRGKELRLSQLQERFGVYVERRIDLPAPQGRSYAILALPSRPPFTGPAGGAEAGCAP